LGKAWGELEEQNSRKVFNLAEKEDQIMRYLAEVKLFIINGISSSLLFLPFLFFLFLM